MPDEADPDDDPDEDPPAVKDRRDLLGVLGEAEPTPLEDLEAALSEATSRSGGLTPPLVLVAGELEPGFDEVETLGAALAAAAPFAAGSDKKLKEAFDQVTESLKSSWAQGSARAAEALSTRLREAFPQGAWSLPQGWLDQQIERALVEKRAYQKRKVLRQDPAPRGARAAGAPPCPPTCPRTWPSTCRSTPASRRGSSPRCTSSRTSTSPTRSRSASSRSRGS